MKKNSLKLLFISSALLLSATMAFGETFEGFSKKLDSWALAMQGKLVSIEGKKCVVDLGKKSGIFPGVSLSITRMGEELLHPMTGASIGRKTVQSGTFTVTEVLEKSSIGICSPTEGETIKKGDETKINSPLNVKLLLDTLGADLGAKAKYAVLDSRLFAETDDSPYSVKCDAEMGANKANCSFAFENIKIAGLSATVAISAVEEKSTKKGSSSATRIWGQNIEEVIVSAAMGRVFGLEDNFSVALASTDKIFIYSHRQQELVLGQTIEKDFIKIVNIETADLNGNGIDEIFVSHTDKKGVVSSFILEYNGKDFSVLEKDLKVLFRSFFINGRKQIISQSFADGDFTGIIYAYGFSGSKYEDTEAFDKTFGARLYGFGSFGDKVAYSLNFDAVGNFTVTSTSGEKFAFGKAFGYTPHKLIFTKILQTGTETDEDGAMVVQYNTKSYGYPVFQRIIELESNPSKFYFLSNETNRRRDGGVDFKGASAGLYMLIKDEAANIWKTSLEGKAAVEADIFDTVDKRFIAVLMQDGRSGANFSPSSSRVEVFEIK